MKVALIAPPFISVPPADYGGTELFVAQLAEGLQKAGIQVVVYANGESTVNVERRWRYERAQWPIKPGQITWLKELDHTAWAVQDATRSCDVVHFQSAQGLALSRFINAPVICTLHGPHDQKLSEFYARYPEVFYVCISEFQCSQESMPRMKTVHHGIDLSQYQLHETKQSYLSFIGRIAPIKGTHLAIEVAKRAGIPLKLAGDIQPEFRDYFEAKVKPQLDGDLYRICWTGRPQGQERIVGKLHGNVVSDPVERAVRTCDVGSHGMRNASVGDAGRFCAGNCSGRNFGIRLPFCIAAREEGSRPSLQPW